MVPVPSPRPLSGSLRPEPRENDVHSWQSRCGAKSADRVVSKNSHNVAKLSQRTQKNRSHEFGAKGDPVFYRKARVTLWYCPGILSGIFAIIIQKSARRRKTRCLTSKHVDNEIRRKFAKSPFDELTEKTQDF
jgi:hypothetical protein